MFYVSVSMRGRKWEIQTMESPWKHIQILESIHTYTITTAKLTLSPTTYSKTGGSRPTFVCKCCGLRFLFRTASLIHCNRRPLVPLSDTTGFGVKSRLLLLFFFFLEHRKWRIETQHRAKVSIISQETQLESKMVERNDMWKVRLRLHRWIWNEGSNVCVGPNGDRSFGNLFILVFFSILSNVKILLAYTPIGKGHITMWKNRIICYSFHSFQYIMHTMV